MEDLPAADVEEMQTAVEDALEAVARLAIESDRALQTDRARGRIGAAAPHVRLRRRLLRVGRVRVVVGDAVVLTGGIVVLALTEDARDET